jgi:hypothetical protein
VNLFNFIYIQSNFRERERERKKRKKERERYIFCFFHIPFGQVLTLLDIIDHALAYFISLHHCISFGKNPCYAILRYYGQLPYEARPGVHVIY